MRRTNPDQRRRRSLTTRTSVYSYLVFTTLMSSYAATIQLQLLPPPIRRPGPPPQISRLLRQLHLPDPSLQRCRAPPLRVTLQRCELLRPMFRPHPYRPRLAPAQRRLVYTGTYTVLSLSAPQHWHLRPLSESVDPLHPPTRMTQCLLLYTLVRRSSCQQRPSSSGAQGTSKSCPFQ